VEKERDHWKEECERVTVENEQLKLLYEELLQQFSGGQTNLKGSSTVLQNTAKLQEHIKIQQNNIEQWKCKCQKTKELRFTTAHWETS